MAGIWDDALATYQGQPGQLPPQFAPQLAPPPVQAPPMIAPVAPMPAPAMPVAAPPMAEAAPAGPVNFNDSIQGYRNAIAKQQGAIRTHAGAQADGAAAIADVNGEQAREIEASNAAFAPEEDDLKAQRADTLARFRASSAANANLRAVDSRTTGQRVMGGLAVAFSALGDAVSKLGGHNDTHYAQSITQQIDQQIARDLEEQRAAIEGKHKATAANLTEFGLAGQLLNDVQEQKQYAGAQIALKYAAKVRELTARSDNATVVAGGELASADLEARAKQTEASLIEKRDESLARERAARAARAGAGGAIPGGQSVGTQAELEAKVAAGITLSKAEAATLRQQQGITATAGKTETAEQKEAAKHANDADEIIPGYAQSDTTVKLTPGEVLQVRNRHRAAVGVEWLSNKLGGLWDTAMNANLPADVREKARTEYTGVKADLQSGKSVQTGQGTITEGDAKRTGDSTPDLPTHWLGGVASVRNYVAGKDPGATSIRAIGRNAREQADRELAESYGVLRKPRAEPSAASPGRSAAPQADAPIVRKAPIFGKKVGS